MKKLILISCLLMLSTGVLAQNNRETNCDEMTTEDFRTLCRQNNQILRRLRDVNGNGHGGGISACTVEYCYYRAGNCAEGGILRDRCNGALDSFYFRSVLVEARNRAHAQSVFVEMSTDGTSLCPGGGTKENSIRSITCDE